MAGRDAHCSDRRILLDSGSLKRPADVLEASARHATGIAIDLAAGSRTVMRPDPRERQKHQKYDLQLEARPDIGFVAFGLDLHGNMGAEAWAKMGDYTRLVMLSQAALGPRATLDRLAPLVSFARAYADALAEQAGGNAVVGTRESHRRW